MAKITKTPKSERSTITIRTKANDVSRSPSAWWQERSEKGRADGLLGTAMFLKELLQYRYRNAALYSRLYSNQPLYGMMGGNLGRISSTNMLPVDRPTMNVVQSCVDTLVSRITQSRPRPVFLTDAGNYKERNLAKRLNQFVVGEIYRSKGYELGKTILRDAAVLGTGVIKVYEGQDKKVSLERVLMTEILVDPNDSLYGAPRQLYQLKLIDRAVLADMFPSYKAEVSKAEAASPDNSADSSKSIADLVMVVEGWRLPSGPDAKDGKHMIACSAGCLFEEEYDKDSFPFVFLHYSPRLLGFFGQPLTEQLMGTQMEINKLLLTISSAINLVGVPRVFVEDGSKVVKAHLNNQVGAIVTYRGTKPSYEVAPAMAPEVYAQLQRLVDYAYQQSGISALAASSKKPDGLNSGAALREYDDLQSDRFADLNKRYDDLYVDLAYKIVDLAKDIAERDGSYATVYPNKNGTREVDLPAAEMLKDTYIIQCFDSSSLPRDPAGRLAKITEMIQAGMVSIQEGRRLLDYPDLDQQEKLANSGEERILKILDEIVDEGKYVPPDAFMELQLAVDLSRQYYNLYVGAKLEEERAEMIRTFNAEAQRLLMPPPAPPMPGGPVTPPGAPAAPPGASSGPQLAQAEPLPTSPLIPQG
jgi:hypothetical protein